MIMMFIIYMYISIRTVFTLINDAGHLKLFYFTEVIHMQVQGTESSLSGNHKVAADDNFKFCLFFKNSNKAWYFMTILMKYHTFLFWKLGKMLQNLSSDAVVFGALRVNSLKKKNLFSK